MLGKNKKFMSGIIVAATFGWNGSTPIKHPLMGAVLTPKCVKNGQEQKTRLNFDVLINDRSERGYKIARCTIFSSLAAEPGKGFAENIARQLAPGRYVEIEADESVNTRPLANQDGTPVIMNGVQATRDYVSYIVNPGGITIYNRDSLETQRHMAEQWLKVRTHQANAWDFLWRPLSISFDPATQKVELMSDADRAVLEATNKIRNVLPLLNGMVTYGFAKVVFPEGAQPVLPNNPSYDTWLQQYIAAGCLGPDGLPVLSVAAPVGQPAGTTMPGAATVTQPATVQPAGTIAMPGAVASAVAGATPGAAVGVAPSTVGVNQAIVTGIPTMSPAVIAPVVAATVGGHALI